MSIMDKQIEKNILMINGIVNSYFIVDQNLKLLKPLLEDKDTYSKWDNTYAVDGVSALRLVLYLHILSDMRAILFDTHKKVASIHNLIKALENPQTVKRLKERFCIPNDVIGDDEFINNIIKQHDIEIKQNAFEDMLSKVQLEYCELKKSELAQRVDDARNQMIAHKEFATVKTQRKMYDASDFGLKFSDAEEIVTHSKNIIFLIYSLFTCSHFDTDSATYHHELVANLFWRKSNT